MDFAVLSSTKGTTLTHAAPGLKEDSGNCGNQVSARGNGNLHCSDMKADVLMTKTLRALKFLFVGPLVLALLVVINLMTSPGDLWVKWAALGIGIAWVISLIRVLFAVVAIGGFAAFLAYLNKSRQ